MKNTIICIGCQYGSGGREIGEKLAEQLGVKHLLLYHTEDKNLARRRELYTAEARQQFQGEVHVPEDLESYELV